MRSLRARLILGTALIALLPLALTTFVLSRRLEAMVQRQAEERLSSAFDGLTAEWLRWTSADDEAAKKLRILAQDPVLRRLYLVPSTSTRELTEYLENRRILLGFDLLEIADSTNRAVVTTSQNEQLPKVTWDHREPIYYERGLVGYVRGGLFIDEDFLKEQKRATGVDLVIEGSAEVPITSTFEDSTLLIPPANSSVTRVSTDRGSFITRSQSFGGAFGSPMITAYVSTEPYDHTITTLQFMTLGMGLLGLTLAVLLGALWSLQISRPVERLADFSRKVAEGQWGDPLQVHSVKELETLVTALDRMRRDLTAYRERLVTSERHAAWSQMARKVAHEVKNPLTPIAVSVADLKRSYEQNREDFPAILDQAVRTISEEVERLKRMLNEFSEFGRLPPPRFEDFHIVDLFTDLATLYAADVRAGRLILEAETPNAPLHADPAQMRQALVNLLQNSLDAVNGQGRVVVTARSQPDHIEISVTDNGPGLTPEQTQRLFSPGFTTKPGGSGLGLVMVERIVNDHHGSITAQSQPGKGTTFTLRLPRTNETEHAIHFDRG